MMVNVTQPRWQNAVASAVREFSLPPAANSVEIQLRTDISTAEQAHCRIIILQPDSGTVEAFGVGRQVATTTHDNSWNGYQGAWPRLGLSEDDEPTWEDAAWQ